MSDRVHRTVQKTVGTSYETVMTLNTRLAGDIIRERLNFGMQVDTGGVIADFIIHARNTDDDIVLRWGEPIESFLSQTDGSDPAYFDTTIPYTEYRIQARVDSGTGDVTVIVKSYSESRDDAN